MSNTVYTSTATATGYANTNTIPPSIVTATATASASSYVSQSDAYNTAYQLALQQANTTAQYDANLISQSVYISEAGGSGSIGPTGPSGPTGPIGGGEGATGPTGATPYQFTLVPDPVNPTDDILTYNSITKVSNSGTIDTVTTLEGYNYAFLSCNATFTDLYDYGFPQILLYADSSHNYGFIFENINGPPPDSNNYVYVTENGSADSGHPIPYQPGSYYTIELTPNGRNYYINSNLVKSISGSTSSNLEFQAYFNLVAVGNTISNISFGYAAQGPTGATGLSGNINVNMISGPNGTDNNYTIVSTPNTNTLYSLFTPPAYRSSSQKYLPVGSKMNIALNKELFFYPGGQVNVITSVGTNIYIGFSQPIQINYSGPLVLNYIAYYDTTNDTWNALPNSGVNGPVFSFAYDSINSILYFGGNFTQTFDKNLALNYIGAYSINTNSISGLGGSYINAQVNTIVYDSINSNLYIGGAFNGNGVNYVGISGTPSTGTWSQVGTITLGSAVYTVNTLIYDSINNALYAGGLGFINSNNGSYNVAQISNPANTTSPSNWESLGSGLNGQVNSLAYYYNASGGSLLYAGGAFTQCPTPTPTLMAHIACISIPSSGSTEWVSLSNNGLNGEVNTLILGGDGDLYIGGSFTATYDQTFNSSCIIKIPSGSTSGWQNVANADNLNASVYSIYMNSFFKLYVGGIFNNLYYNQLAQLSNNYINLVDGSGNNYFTLIDGVNYLVNISNLNGITYINGNQVLNNGYTRA